MTTINSFNIQLNGRSMQLPQSELVAHFAIPLS
ncbi:Uncharacterised protein [Serratia fonticola]|nr:Uncharacterised protein [Serratia fonticola]